MAGLVIGAVLLSGVSFYAGASYARGSQTGGGGFRNGGQAGQGARTGARNFGGAITGQVVSKDATSITVQGRDGSSRVVFYSTSTPVMKTASGSLTDVVTGTQISAIGDANTDGSVNARSIQLRPAGDFGPGAGGQAGAPAAGR